jgi:predicted DNA-binding ribbon-helix-helix protein
MDEQKGNWMDKATSVSVRASRPYLQALRELAKRRNTRVASLVRDALDKAYGDDLSPLSSFFEETVNELGRISIKVDGNS